MTGERTGRFLAGYYRPMLYAMSHTQDQLFRVKKGQIRGTRDKSEWHDWAFFYLGGKRIEFTCNWTYFKANFRKVKKT